jgi:2-keto-4-pentenoate hydratase/2-oxohepta-3-ene-1,7-dioic acid hydratase in catechol pathway
VTRDEIADPTELHVHTRVNGEQVQSFSLSDMIFTIAQLMGHTNVDVTLNVWTQVLDGSLRAAVDKVCDGLFTIVHQPEAAGWLTH